MGDLQLVTVVEGSGTTGWGELVTSNPKTALIAARLSLEYT